jgi:hypothetical protein
MKSITIKQITIKKLKEYFDKKIFAVPQLQREFVWTQRKVCDLLDSILNNYPIGTVLIWDAHKNYEAKFRQDYISLPLYDSIHNKRIYLIIDGQQRLSVLFHAFKGDKIRNSDDKDIFFDKVYYNLDKSAKMKFRSAKKNAESEVKVKDILDSNWKKIFEQYKKREINQIKEVRNKILKYKIPFIFVETADIKDVETSFIRINTGGTSLSSADRALAQATSIDLRHNINSVRNQLGYGFDKLDKLSMLMTIALIWGTKQVGKKGVEAMIDSIQKNKSKIEEFEDIWLQLKDCYGKAVDYLYKNMFVINHDFLPSQNMITVLSCFYYFNGGKEPLRHQREQIAKWFWYTAVGSRYSGRGYGKNILEDYSFFKKLGSTTSANYIIREKISRREIGLTDYSKRSSVSNAFFCLLASLKPRYLDGGGEIPLERYSVRANRKNKHHIFPKGHLIPLNIKSREYNNIANICYLVWKENIEVGKKPPRVYLKPYRKRDYFAQVMKSHLIPFDEKEGIWDANSKKGFKLFKISRAKMICHKFEKLAGTKLFITE